jgi:myo-inositol-1(or 4)-monophosphatase
MTAAALAALALAAAREAASLCAQGYRSHPSADAKGKKDLVTEFDRRSEALLVERLAPIGYPIVGEEGARVGGAAERIWYVDPLDGTANFVHGHPFWSVSVGLCERGEPICGAVVAPAIALFWHGYRGAETNAFRNDDVCRVSDTGALEDSLVATGFPRERDRHPDDNFATFIRVKRAALGVRRCGSAAVDLCMVADGTYDGFWERRLSAWDTVAGAAIALAAGARVTALDGGTPDYAIGHLVASNGRIHDALLRTIAEPT